MVRVEAKQTQAGGRAGQGKLGLERGTPPGGSPRAMRPPSTPLTQGGTTTQRTTPIQVPALTGVTALAAGRGHSLAVRHDGGWDSNS